MSTPINPRREHPSTYFVQNRSNEEEMIRLQLQGQLITASMGGVLPEQLDPTIFQSVLDVGCGTGDWLIQTAAAYPTISSLVGVDISEKVLGYARIQAEAQQVSDRVQFRTMDALRMLEFPSSSFDLVNQRLGWSYLRKWDWPKLLNEYLRLTRPDGVIRITESDIITESSSPALLRLNQLAFEAFYQAGHFFIEKQNGITSELARLLRQHGVQQVQTRSHKLEYRAGTLQGQSFYEDMKRLFRTGLPFMQKWRRMPDDYETIYQQALVEMQQPDFVAIWHYLTIWGTT